MMEQKGFLQELLKDDTEGADFGIVKLSLPKFKVHSKLQLADTLKAMGVTSLFDIAAEFFPRLQRRDNNPVFLVLFHTDILRYFSPVFRSNSRLRGQSARHPTHSLFMQDIFSVLI